LAALYQQLESPWGTAAAFLNLSDVAYLRSEYVKCKEYAQKSLSFFREFGNLWGISCCFFLMGEAACKHGAYAEARWYTGQCFQLLLQFHFPLINFFSLFGLDVVVQIWLGEGETEKDLLAHCRGCPECAELLNDYGDIHREIESLKELSSNVDQTQCPGAELWIKLAAGIMDKKQAMQLVKHACECRSCAEQLTRAQAYVADGLEQVAGLESVTPEWQRAVARQMAAHPPVSKEKKIHRFRLFWLPAIAVAVAVFIVGFLYFARSRNVDQLLAQAYGQNRTLELRFSGAQYGPIRIERSGNGQSILNQSPALLEALPLISRRLEKEPNNPVWLDAKGRADLLGRNYEAAIQSFQKALEVEPDSPSLLTDAASAYFVRAQVADRPEDYGKAIELLGSDAALASTMLKAVRRLSWASAIRPRR
jgi:tetratricopeptide (TPR) repeat protein